MPVISCSSLAGLSDFRCDRLARNSLNGFKSGSRATSGSPEGVKAEQVLADCHRRRATPATLMLDLQLFPDGLRRLPSRRFTSSGSRWSVGRQRDSLGEQREAAVSVFQQHRMTQQQVEQRMRRRLLNRFVANRGEVSRCKQRFDVVGRESQPSIGLDQRASSVASVGKKPRVPFSAATLDPALQHRGRQLFLPSPPCLAVLPAQSAGRSCLRWVSAFQTSRKKVGAQEHAAGCRGNAGPAVANRVTGRQRVHAQHFSEIFQDTINRSGRDAAHPENCVAKCRAAGSKILPRRCRA